MEFDSRANKVDPRGYEAALAALSGLINQRKRADGSNWGDAFALMRSYVKVLDLEGPIDQLSIIHVAGTKGKGSTCAMAESMLRASGHTTGLFTSPHLVDVRERFRLNGEMVSVDTFLKHFWWCYDRCKEAASSPSSPIPMPAYFRFLTLLALRIFTHTQVDVAILEVGIGGRFDATNIVNASLAVSLCRQWAIRSGREKEADAIDQALADKTLPPAYIKGLGCASWPGRCEILQDCPTEPGQAGSAGGQLTFFLDGAHTVESMEVCGEWFSEASRDGGKDGEGDRRGAGERGGEGVGRTNTGEGAAATGAAGAEDTAAAAAGAQGSSQVEAKTPVRVRLCGAIFARTGCIAEQDGLVRPRDPHTLMAQLLRTLERKGLSLHRALFVPSLSSYTALLPSPTSSSPSSAYLPSSDSTGPAPNVTSQSTSSGTDASGTRQSSSLSQSSLVWQLAMQQTWEQLQQQPLHAVNFAAAAANIGAAPAAAPAPAPASAAASAAGSGARSVDSIPASFLVPFVLVLCLSALPFSALVAAQYDGSEGGGDDNSGGGGGGGGYGGVKCDPSSLPDYDYSVKLNDRGLILHWKTVSSTTVNFAAQALAGPVADGWFAVGWSGSSGRMIPGEAVIGNLPGGTMNPYYLGYYSMAEVVPTINFSIGSAGNEAVLTKNADNSTIMKFSRSINDGTVKVLLKGVNYMIWAYSDGSQTLAQHPRSNITLGRTARLTPSPAPHSRPLPFLLPSSSLPPPFVFPSSSSSSLPLPFLLPSSSLPPPFLFPSSSLPPPFLFPSSSLPLPFLLPSSSLPLPFLFPSSSLPPPFHFPSSSLPLPFLFLQLPCRVLPSRGFVPIDYSCPTSANSGSSSSGSSSSHSPSPSPHTLSCAPLPFLVPPVSSLQGIRADRLQLFHVGQRQQQQQQRLSVVSHPLPFPFPLVLPPPLLPHQGIRADRLQLPRIRRQQQQWVILPIPGVGLPALLPRGIQMLHTAQRERVSAVHCGAVRYSYIGVGFSKDGKMTNSDAAIGNVPPGTLANGAAVGPYYMSGHELQSVTPTAMWSVTNTSVTTSNGYTIIKFTRTMGTGYVPINAFGPTTIIWAYSPDGSTTLADHRSNYGSASIDFVKGTVSGGHGSSTAAYIAHGALLSIAFALLMPLAILLARLLLADRPDGAPLNLNRASYIHADANGVAPSPQQQPAKNLRPMGFQLHRGIQVFALVVAVAGMIVIIVQAGSKGLSWTHGQVGLAAVILALVQAIVGFVRPDKTAPNRFMWLVAHCLIGATTIALAWAAMFLGIDLYHTKFMENVTWCYWVCGVCVGVFGVAYLVLVIPDSILSLKGRKDHGDDGKGTGTPAAF
ncbi:unnamed protein product [Closterium sp. NIES-53]